MKNWLFRIYMYLMKIGARFTKIRENKIVVLNGAGRSGSHLPLATWREIGAAKFILTTHQPFKIHAKQVNIQFWHGIPLKRMGIMANNTKRKTDMRNAKLWQKNADVVCSSSDLYETLMSACCAIETTKYQKVGFPRLDALKHPALSKAQLLTALFKVQDEQAQIAIYMPTFRYEMEDEQIMAQIKAGNFFALPDFDAESLNESLKAKHQYLIVKLHPYEMQLLGTQTSHYSNIAYLNNDYLFAHDYDLYELLGNTDMLITCLLYTSPSPRDS